MDQLVGLSDDLGKLDGYVEQVTRKVAAYLGEVLEDQKDKLQENLTANNSKIFVIIQFKFNLDKIYNFVYCISYILLLVFKKQN